VATTARSASGEMTQDGGLGAKRDGVPPILAEQLGQATLQIPRALDDLPGQDSFIVGTTAWRRGKVEGKLALS
jgi:hypothetical protein